MTEIFTAFEGERRLASGPRAEIILAVRQAARGAAAPIAVFSDTSGRAVDFDLRDVAHEGRDPSEEPRGRGRPKLGVVAREVTLLPRHWEWLNSQPGGASVALRKLVDAARRSSGDADRQREAAYHFMSAMAGNLVGFEEASRALFADDRRRFTGLIAAWPADIRDHVVRLAYSDYAG
jgi:hypothetical protein